MELLIENHWANQTLYHNNDFAALMCFLNPFENQLHFVQCQSEAQNALNFVSV